MKWFRFYHDSIFDPKIQTLPGDLYKAWCNILCLASKHKKRGLIPPVSTISFHLRISEDQTQSILDELHQRKLIDKTREGYHAHDWNEWQTSTSANAARQKRYRERHKKASDCKRDADRNVTDNASRNATGDETVTGDTDREREEEKDTPQPPSGGPVCVTETQPEPLPIPDDDEPFAAPGVPLAAPPRPPVQNDPAEVRRVAAKAERLFPGLDFGPKVDEVSGDVPMARLDRALEIAHGKGNRRWDYILGIVRRLGSEAAKGDATIPLHAYPAPAPPKPRELHKARAKHKFIGIPGCSYFGKATGEAS